MASYSLNNFTAPDAYLPPGTTAANGRGAATGPATLQDLPELDHINLNVANSAVFFSLELIGGTTRSLSGQWQPETFMLPGFLVIQRKGIIGIRVRAAVLAVNIAAGQTQSQVTVEAVEAT